MFGLEHPEISKLQFFLGSIIEQKFMTPKIASEWGVNFEDAEKYYNCLYRYSHTRLVGLFKVSPIGIIYEKFYNDAKDQVLESEPAWSKNKELYSKIMQEFLSVFRGEVNITSLIE